MKNTNVKCHYKGLAQSISKHVSSLKEVNFNDSTLTNKLANDWKKKPDRKMRSKLRSMWKNCCLLRNEVQTILSGKASTLLHTDGKTSSSRIEDCSESSDTVSCTSIVDLPLKKTNAKIDVRCDTAMTLSVLDENIVTSKRDCDFFTSSDQTTDVLVHKLSDETIDNRCVSNSTVNSVENTPHIYTDDILEHCEESRETLEKFDSYNSRTTIATTYRTYRSANCKRPIVKSPAGDSIYDFSDSEDERVIDEKNKKCRNTSAGQISKAKYNADIGVKLIFSARFKDSDGIVTKDTLRRALRIALATEYGCTCTLRFSTIRINETDVVAYARCVSVEHKQCFKFTIFGLNELKVTLHAASSDKISYRHVRPNFSQLRGAERNEVKNALKIRPPRDYQMEVARNIDPALAADGHMQDLRKLYIYQKAKSEENCKNDLTLQSGDVSDLIQLWVIQNREKDPYLRQVSLPFTAMMFTEAQLDLLNHSKRIVLHLDATGSVVRKPSHLHCKRIYYYVIVAKHNESVIPIAEMVTSEHNIKSIATFLKTYKFFVVEKLKTWPFVSAVVVDWSWALINSLLFEWNQMSVGEYLDMAYNYVTSGRKPKNIIIVQTCCAHFMKRMSMIITKDFSQYDNIKSFLLECIALMMLCREMRELDYVFEHFVKAVSTPDKDDAQSSLRALQKIVAERQVDITEIFRDNQNKDGSEELERETQKPMSDLKSLKKSKAIFANSPFFAHFENKLREVEKEIDSEKPITNKYHVPGFARQMTWKHLAYAPFWTSLMLNLVDKKISRLSNAYVESYNRVIKHHVLNHQKNLKIGHFVRKTELYTRNLIAEANLDVCLKTKEPSQKPKYPATVATNVVSTSRSKEYDIIPNYSAEGNVDEIVPQTEDAGTKNLEPKDFDETYPEEAADPLIGETWKDKKKCFPAKGHFGGHVIGRILAETNKKAPKRKVTTSSAVEQVKRARLTTPDCDNFDSSNVVNNSSVLEKPNVLENGLFNDVRYYMQSKSHNVRIACFIATDNPPIRSNCFQLTARQFHTLTPNRWMDGLVIDCYAMTHIDTWTNAMYLSTDDTGSILGDNWDKRKPASCGIYNISRSLSGKIFMPYLYYGHWRLFVVDVDEKTLTLLDPYEDARIDEVRVHEAFDKFLEFSSKNSSVSALRKIQWTRKEENIRPYQPPNDGSNCGAYVSHYVECLAKHEPFDLAFNPLEFREHMAKTLIEKSVSIKEMCLYCFGKRFHHDVAVCAVCHHWCHTHCLDRGEYDSEREEEEDHQIKRFKKWSKDTETLSRGEKENIRTDSHEVFTCKLCKRNNMS